MRMVGKDGRPCARTLMDTSDSLSPAGPRDHRARRSDRCDLAESRPYGRDRPWRIASFASTGDGRMTRGQITPSARSGGDLRGARPSSSRIASVCSPRSGGGVRMDAGVAASSSGIPTWVIGAQTRMLHAHGHPARLRLRATRRPPGCRGSGPNGMPAASRRADQSATVAAREARGEERAQSSRVMLDAVAVGGEARVRRQGRQAERLAEPRPLPVRPDRHRQLAIARRERLVRDDVRDGRCRAGPGARPLTNAFCAWFTRTARVEASSETSIRWPRTRMPRRSSPLASSPARTPIVANSPVTTSLIATPTLVGMAAVGVGGRR